MVKEIMTVDDYPLLHSMSRKAPEKVSEEIIIDLIDTLLQNEVGIGLAAIQIGIPLRIFCMKNEAGHPEVFINPNILEHSKEKVMSYEKCLSVPDTTVAAERWKEIKIKYTDEFGHKIVKWLQGSESVIAQHEYDHLNGILITDRKIFNATLENKDGQRNVQVGKSNTETV